MSEMTFFTSIARGIRPEIATRRIAAFSKRFGPGHLYLAQHAAFPLALTPELLYGLWYNFRNFTEPTIPWVAVADLLLSTLCTEVGHELYEMDVTLRTQLLENLKENFGETRLLDLSHFLQAYISKYLTGSDPRMRGLAKTQQWVVFGYIKPDRAVQELANALRTSIQQEEKTEQVRIASITEMLAEQLKDFLPFLTFAKGTALKALGNETAALAEFRKITEEAKLASLGLQLPQEVVIELEKVQKVQRKPEPVKVSTTRTKRKKLFVVTIGTVAANVGQELIRQVEEHPQSELRVLLRSLDTARLDQRRTVRDGEWLQMTIDQRHMRTMHQRRHTEPYLGSTLYDDLLPFTTGVGASRIRYNGAGAIAVNRGQIRRWLSESISTLSRSKGDTSVSFAIIVSAVGATGSGSVQHLVNLLAEAASNASIETPINCDLFIMLPEPEGVDTLGLANTFSLFAELAAARLSRSHTDTENFQGRIIPVGWGKTRSLKSIAQLEETTATLVRLINDPTTEFARVYEDSRVDHHALRQLDEMTLLPTHLSSVTAVTISLGTLENQIVERNTADLIEHLIFGGETSPDDTLFLETLNNYIPGERPEEQCESLLEFLAGSIRLQTWKPTIEAEATGRGIIDPKAWLSQKWLADKASIDWVTGDIEQTGRALVRDLIRTWKTMQYRGITNSSANSLASITRSYQQLKERLRQILVVAQEDIQFRYSNDDVNRSLSAINIQGRDGEVPRKENDKERPGLIRTALGRVKQNVIDYRDQKANPIAILVLRSLLNEAEKAYRDLAIVLTRLSTERQRLEAVADQRLYLGSDHMLEIAALSNVRDIDRYYQQISPFAQGDKLRSVTDDESIAADPYLEFRLWLGSDPDREELLFIGDIDLLREMARDYTQTVVAEQVEKNNVLDILLRDSGITLRQRLREAATVAYPLINYNTKFAPDERKEKLHICAYWNNDKKRRELQQAVEEAFGQRRCTLLPAKDPTEIVIFYYVDGLSMAAIPDLTGRCSEAFLQQRKRWLDQRKDNPTQNIGIPVYSGKDAEERVLKQDIICKLNIAAQKDLCPYKELPEAKNCTKDCL